MLSFTDFMKVFSAYEQYVQSATPAPQPMPTVPTVPTPAPQPMPTVPTVPTPAPQPMPTVPTPAPQPIVPLSGYQYRDEQPISMNEYVQRLNAFDQRLTAQENRPPMPTIDTPKPATVDDIIMGIVGNTRKENSDGKQ